MSRKGRTMKRSRFTAAQFIGAGLEGRSQTADLCRKQGIRGAIVRNRKAKCGGLMYRWRGGWRPIAADLVRRGIAAVIAYTGDRPGRALWPLEMHVVFDETRLDQNPPRDDFVVVGMVGLQVRRLWAPAAKAEAVGSVMEISPGTILGEVAVVACRHQAGEPEHVCLRPELGFLL